MQFALLLNCACPNLVFPLNFVPMKFASPLNCASEKLAPLLNCASEMSDGSTGWLLRSTYSTLARYATERPMMYVAGPVTMIERLAVKTLSTHRTKLALTVGSAVVAGFRSDESS